MNYPSSISFAAISLLAMSCQLSDSAFGGLASAACPAFTMQGDVLAESFDSDARISGKVATFVQASKDLANVSWQAEAEAADACLRMGADLGIPPATSYSDEPGEKVRVACGALTYRLDEILRQGLSVQVMVTAPQCSANFNAQGNCASKCGGSVQGSSGDAECDASCRAHAEFQGTCTPIAVVVQPVGMHPMALQVVGTLQRNLPALLHAQWVLGKRLIASADVVVQVGQNLPSMIAHAGAKATACLATATSANLRASARIKVTVQASANVSGRVGVQ